MGVDESLIKNTQNQLNRLIKQLGEIESEKDTLDEDEYKEMKSETIDQIKALGKTLEKLEGGTMTLDDELTWTKRAIRAAISDAFKTPEVIAMFAKKQPGLLRNALVTTEAHHKMHKLTESEYTDKKLEILIALKNLNDNLSDDERKFIDERLKTQEFELEDATPNRVFHGEI